MQALQRGGWRTGAFGKVHFRPHFAGVYPDYKPYGFDVTHITEDPRGGEWLDWVEHEHPQHYEAALTTVWATEIPDYAAYGPRQVNLRERIVQLRAGFQWASAEFPQSTHEEYPLPFPEHVSQTNWITEQALTFLQETPPDQPLYAHISYVQPHNPFCPPAEYVRCVNVDAIPEPLPAEWLEDPHAPAYFRARKPRPSGNWRFARQLYFADIVHLDRQLGRVVDALERMGRLDDTYVLLLADHGELLFDHGFRGKEERHYDACIRVPLIISGPGLQSGNERGEMVQLEDICPTVLEMTGESLLAMPKMGPYLRLAAGEIPVLPGRSLLPLCRGEPVEGWRDAAYCESYNAIWSNDPGDWARTIRTPEYRYTFYPGGGDQLFDLVNDPGEQSNLVGDRGYVEVQGRLRDRLWELIVLQDYPKTRRELFALGVH
jgi:arylsulfatase A-like enzyme